jgi:hypothetical protein
MGGGSEEHGGGHGEKPSVFVHSHSNGHTVHVFHSDGQHEAHEHGHGESESVADRVHESLGGEQRPGETEHAMGAESDSGQSGV